MKLRDKSQLTGKELCDLEGIVFPVMAGLSENSTDKEKQEALIGMVAKRGKDIVKLCYLDEHNHKFDKVEIPYRMKLTNDMPKIIEYIFGKESGEDNGKKSEAMKISR